MLLADFSALSIRLPVLTGIKLGGKIDTPTFHTFKRIFLSNQIIQPTCRPLALLPGTFHVKRKFEV